MKEHKRYGQWPLNSAPELKSEANEKPNKGSNLVLPFSNSSSRSREACYIAKQNNPCLGASFHSMWSSWGPEEAFK